MTQAKVPVPGHESPAGPGSPGGPGDPVIGAVLAELLAGDALVGFLQAEQYRQIETARRRALATADPLGRGDRALEEGFALRSVVAELAVALRVHEKAMAGLFFEARQFCGPFRATLAALAAGAIGPRHARALLAGALGLPAELLARFEGEALGLAQRQTPTAFTRSLARLRERLEPELLAARVGRARAARRVVFEPDADGMAWLHLFLEAEPALAISGRLGKLAAVALAEAAADATPIPAGARGQLEADIAAELLLGLPARAAGGTGPDDAGDSGSTGAPVRTRLPGVAFRRPEVFVTVPRLTIGHDTLLGLSEEPAELAGYGPIDAGTARRLAAQAPTLHRMLVDPLDGAPLQLDPKRYRLSASLRRWIQQRDECCRFPGCTRLAEYCDIDHTLARAHGGQSSPDNLALLCRHHHRLKHNSRWRVRQLGRGVLRWTSPTGRSYDTLPGGPARHRPPPPAAMPGPGPRATPRADPEYPDRAPF